MMTRSTRDKKFLVLIYCSPITEVISKVHVDSRLFQDAYNEMLNVL